MIHLIFYAIVLCCGAMATFIMRAIAVKLRILNKPNPLVPQHVEPTAYLGGIGIFLGMTAGLIICYFFYHKLFIELEKSLPSISGLVIGSAGFLIWGVVDDLRALEPFPKFIGQMAISIVTVLLGVRTHMFQQEILDFLFSWFWILFVVNAVNFTDVCDGLAGSICCVTFFTVGVFFHDVRIFCFLISASTFGFLFFNSPKASIFMGDAGSHMLGFLLAATGFMKSHELLFFDAAIWLVLLASLPAFELLFITMIRITKRVPWWKGSLDHFSLRLQAGHFSRWQIDIFSAVISAVVVGVACVLNFLDAWLKISLLVLITGGYAIFARILLRWEAKPRI